MPPSSCAAPWSQTCWRCSPNGGTTRIPWTAAPRTGCCCSAWPECPGTPKPLPATAPPPPPAGPHAVQLLRTYGLKRPPFPFAPDGERSIARAYAKAFARARSLIYIEDQYLWSTEVAAGIAEALERNPGLNVIVVVPRYPDSDGPLAGPPSRIGQLRAIRMLRRAAPDRVGVFDLENSAGTPIYVHAKICIIDDAWLTCGSDNFNRRSWTTDSELTCAVLDTTADNRERARHDTGHDASRPLAHGSASNSGPNTWASTRTIPGSTTRRPGSSCGTPPPTLSTAGTKPAAARPDPPDRCATTLQNPSRPSNASGRIRSAASSSTRTAAPAGCAALPSSSCIVHGR